MSRTYLDELKFQHSLLPDMEGFGAILQASGEVDRLRLALATARTAAEQAQRDAVRVEVIRRADWIASPSSIQSPVVVSHWRVHVSIKESGQTTAYGPTLIAALDNAATWPPLAAALLAAQSLPSAIRGGEKEGGAS